MNSNNENTYVQRLEKGSHEWYTYVIEQAKQGTDEEATGVWKKVPRKNMKRWNQYWIEA